MTRTYNNIEEYITQFLSRLGVFYPHQLNAEDVASRLGLGMYYLPFESMFIDGNFFIDIRKNDAEQWQDFGHELCHALWHAGDQAIIPLSMRDYQEWKAENFAQHLCIPTFMLDRLEMPNTDKRAIWLIVETFGVTWEFAEKRLRQYMQNLMYR